MTNFYVVFAYIINRTWTRIFIDDLAIFSDIILYKINDVYKSKYMKYKSKYIGLKNYQTGGVKK